MNNIITIYMYIYNLQASLTHNSSPVVYVLLFALRFALTGHSAFGRIIKLNICLPVHNLTGLRIAGGGRVTLMEASGPAKRQKANLACSIPKNVSFRVKR